MIRIKRFFSNLFFNTRMSLGIVIFTLRKSSGYYLNFKSILSGLKNDGFYKLEKYYSGQEIEDLKKTSHDILDNLDNIFEENNNIKKNVERTDGEIKIKYVHEISKKLRVYFHEALFIVIALFFYGKPKTPNVFFHLLHDGDFKHRQVPGKSKVRPAGKYHSDSLDRHILKCYVLLDDVTPDGGGETIIVAKSSQKLRYLSKKKSEFFSGYNTDDYSMVEKELRKQNIITDSNIKRLYGKKGDLFFLDTSNIHKGADLKKGLRRVLWINL